jgi:hypothetical protein
MRWQEEVTLTGYEMQWTVRYFQHMSRKWELPSNSSGIGPSRSGSSSSGPDMAITLSNGAIAYWKRKQAVWEDLMKKADNIYRKCHPAYDSPL